MATYLLARIDGDIYAVDHDGGDNAASIGEALELALAPSDATIHVALVEASDAGEARLLGASVAYWIGVTDTDCDAIAQVCHCMDLDPESIDVDSVLALATALVDATDVHMEHDS